MAPYHLLTPSHVDRNIVDRVGEVEESVGEGGGKNNTGISDGNQYVIPRILHRTWKSDDVNSMPGAWRAAYGECKRLHPAWTSVLWTDVTMRELIANNYSWFLADYDSYRYNIQRVDSARYFILHHFGGVYMDLDIGCRHQLAPLRHAASKTGAMFPLTSPVGWSNDVMFASPRHPFFRRLIGALQGANRCRL
nr:hypothetical protein BaRGS_032739 [Batillaria attramentaria]